VTDHDFGDDQDPLLVRPFVLHDSESSDADPSTQTWPSATTREVRSRHAGAGASPTEVIPRVAPKRRLRHRLLLAGGAGTVVVVAAAAAAFAALRPEVSPSVGSGADAALPVVTGPATSPVVTPAATSSSSRTAHSTRRSVPAPAKVSASVTLSSGTPSSSSPSGRSPSPAPANSTGAGFGPHNAAPATDRTGTIRGQNGLCLDLNGNLPFDGNHVDAFTCNNTGAQVWTLATDGTLRVDGKCALIVGDDTVHVVTCDGRTTAQWRASGSTLVNAADDRCLTDPSGGGRSGTPVVVTRCDGSAGQRWSLP
jgi:hypothetical protein